MNKLFAILLILSSYSGVLTAQNAFDFDGIDDYAQVPDASTFLQSDSVSITLWVYPTTVSSGWPDLEGFAGFRNDQNADFYIIQLDSNSVEARFRNDVGTAYDINYTGLKLDEWQHFAFTYDKDSLRLYRNGLQVGITFASGKMFQPNQTFNIGYLPYSNTPFHLDGKLDELSLWDKALSDAEISCIYTNGIDIRDSKLRLFYPFNQGFPGGLNTGEDTILTYFSPLHAQIINANLSGSESNWVYGIDDPYHYNLREICTGDTVMFHGQTLTQEAVYSKAYVAANQCDSFDVLYLKVNLPPSSVSSASICEGDTFVLGNKSFTETGYYDVWYTTSNGCDSISFVDLTVYPSPSVVINDTFCKGSAYIFNGNQILIDGTYWDTVKTNHNCDSVTQLELEMIILDTGLTVMTNILTANELFATSYQWIDCASGLPLVGETGRSVVINKTGRYKALVQKDDCVHSTRCGEVEIANGIKDNHIGTPIIQPNPFQDKISISIPKPLEIQSISVFNVLGERMVMVKDPLDETELDTSEWPQGMYIVQGAGARGGYSFKMIKQ